MMRAASPTPSPSPRPLAEPADAPPWRRKRPITCRWVMPAARSSPTSRVRSASVMASVFATRNEPTASATSPNRKAIPANPSWARPSCCWASATVSTTNGSVIVRFSAAVHVLGALAPRPGRRAAPAPARRRLVEGGRVEDHDLPCWRAPTPRSPSRPAIRWSVGRIGAGQPARRPPRGRSARPGGVDQHVDGGSAERKLPASGRRCGPRLVLRIDAEREHGSNTFSSGPGMVVTGSAAPRPPPR